MKYFAVRLGLALALGCCTISSHAQFADVTGGSVIIDIATPLADLLSTHNLTAAAYTEAPYDNQIPYLGIISGAFDHPSGRGSFAAEGDFAVTDGTNIIKVIGLNFEVHDRHHSLLTGNVYFNGKYVSHIAVLEVKGKKLFEGPQQDGQLVEVKNIAATLSPAMSAIIDSVFGVKIPAYTSAATITITTSFTLVSGSDRDGSDRDDSDHDHPDHDDSGHR